MHILLNVLVQERMFKAFLVKYAEIGIKGKNRYLFEEALVNQIRHALKKVEGEFKVSRTQGRIYVDALSEFDFDEAILAEGVETYVKILKKL